MGTKITSLLSLTLLITIYKKQKPQTGTKTLVTDHLHIGNLDIKKQNPLMGTKTDSKRTNRLNSRQYKKQNPLMGTKTV